jgi:hypothetical protein
MVALSRQASQGTGARSHAAEGEEQGEISCARIHHGRYVPAEFRGHRLGLLDLPTCESSYVAKRRKPKRDEACKLALKGTWKFNGHGLPYTERWTFTPAKRRNARRVRPSFKLKINRVRNLPTLPELKLKVDGFKVICRIRRDRFDWRPDQYQLKSVQWTRLPKIETNIDHGFAPFSGGKSV